MRKWRGFKARRLVPLDKLEGMYARRVLAHCGKKVLAARLLGVDRKTLYKLIGWARKKRAVKRGRRRRGKR